MSMEDYYGFSQKKSIENQVSNQKSSNRTEKSQRNNVFIRKSPLRTLKRTELSNDKLNSRDSKRARKFEPPRLQKRQNSKQQSYNGQTIMRERDGLSSNRQQIEMMAKKYDHYKNTDSYQFKQTEMHPQNKSSYVSSSQNNDQYNQRGYRFQKETPVRKNRFQNEQQPISYDKQYRSASRGRNESFLVHFQRQAPPTNAIERYTQNHSASNDIRSKKSRSLGAKFKPYKMHTFYNAQKMQYYNYNEEGYLTDRQYELLNRIQEKALKAFERAIVENNSQQKQSKKPRKSKPFDIQESSKIQHKNSGILQGLRNDDEYGQTPLTSRRQLSKELKMKKSQKVIEVSINPRKSKQYDDYQMSITSKNKLQKEQSQNYDDQRIGLPQVKKDMFRKFASQNDSSLLEWSPKKPNEEPGNPNIERQDSVKRSSSISNDYKSIDMMEINSNYKPSAKEIRERAEFIIDDNRSLGMNTIRNQPINSPNPKVQDVKSDRDSNLQLSSSNSSSSEHSSSQNASKNQSNRKSSKKSSNISQKQEADSKPDFNKNKMKKSYSMSQPYSQSSLNDNLKKIENISSNKDIVSNFKKANHPLTQSERLLSSKDSISLQANNTSNNSQKVKIKRLVKVTKPQINEPQQHHFQDNLDILGVHSIQNYQNVTESIKVKVNPISKNSKISERSPRSQMEQASVNLRQREASKFKQKPSNNSSFRQKSQASIAYRSKLRGSYHNNSNVQYDLFGEIHDFIELEEFQYHETRRAKQVRQLIPDQLDEILGKIEDHLYFINCIAEIILLVPDVYDFETIYDKGKDWIFLEVFLTLKKFIFERSRVITALRGGKNCFNLLDYIIQDNMLRKYLPRVEITNILYNLEDCNLKLDKLINNFYNFLIKFNKEGYSNSQIINLKPFKMNEDLVLLLTQYIRQVETLKTKKEQQFNGGDISPDDEDEYEMMVLLNERIFRLMEMSFVMSNLAGRQIKSIEKDAELFKEEEKFKTYLFQNQDLFKEIVKYFK